MEFIKTTFTITDLEHFSGIKKHTIRIWEKRYNLLSPERTETNIRYYSSASLRHLLNIVLLYNNGYKISRIAGLNRREIITHCKELVSEQAEKNQFINDMKIAMLHFDQQLFEKTFRKLSQRFSFQEVFLNYFLPLLNEIGLLWQTTAINPAHEHFISNLIKQKILIYTESLVLKRIKHKTHRFILFLPDNEIHDLGITYLNFEILNKGFQSIFLGPSVPLDSLSSFNYDKGTLIYIAYFTVKPAADKITDYLEKINSTVLSSGNAQLWILGHQAQLLPQDKLPERISVFASIPEALDKINSLAV